MSFQTIVSSFSRFVFDSGKRTFIFGTTHYVNTILKSNYNINSFYIEQSTISITVDPIALSFLIFGKSLPDLIDLETRYKSLFGYFLYSILDEKDEVIADCIRLLEDHFDIGFRNETKEILNQIFPKDLKRLCIEIVNDSLYGFVENYLPIVTQEDLEESLLEIQENFTRRAEELISSALVESQSTSTVNLRSGRVKASRNLWSAYKFLLMKEEGFGRDYQAILKDLKAKAVSADEPFFNIRTRVLKIYSNMNIERYIQNETLDFDNLRLSISTASTYKDLWFYAVKMKGLIFEVICSIWLSVKYGTRIEYRCEPNKQPLSMILGIDVFEKVVSIISSDFQTIDPVPDFFDKTLDSEGNIIYWIIEVGWWTDAQSKKVQEEEKWAPFITAAEKVGVKMKLQIFVQTSRKMDEWPVAILRHKDSMKWVEASKSAFRILMLTPDEEEELETTMLSSTEARRLVSIKSRVICPLTDSDYIRKETQVLNSIKSNLTLNYMEKDDDIFSNETAFDLNRIVSIVHKLEETLKEKSEKILDIDFEIDQIYFNLRSIFNELDTDSKEDNPLVDKINNISFRKLFLDTFHNEEKKLIIKKVSLAGKEVERKIDGTSKSIVLEKGPQLSIFKLIDRYRNLNIKENYYKLYGKLNKIADHLFLSDSDEIGTKFSDSLIDSLLRMPMPGRTSRQKRIRKYYSTMYMRLIKAEGIKYFVDRMMRVTSATSAHQNIGGKIDESKLIGFEKTIVRNVYELINNGFNLKAVITNVSSKLNNNKYDESILEIISYILRYSELEEDSSDQDRLDVVYNGNTKKLSYVICVLVDFLIKIFQEGIILKGSYTIIGDDVIVLKNVLGLKQEDSEEENILREPNNVNVNDNEVLTKAIENTMNLNWFLYINNNKNFGTLSDEIFTDSQKTINEGKNKESVLSTVLSARDETIIERVYELLGHRSLEEQKDLLKERISGENYQRNNPSIKYSLKEVLEYNDKMLKNELSNFGKFVCLKQSKTLRKTMNEFWEDYIIYSKKTQDEDSVILINLFYENFNLSKMNNQQATEFKLHISNLSNMALMLCCYQQFVNYLLLSTIAKAHLLVNNKYNGLKEHSIPSINAKLYVMQPDRPINSTTPCVLCVNNFSFHRFNLDYVKSKLWLSLPYMILLSYCELSQEYGLYNQGIIFSNLYKHKQNPNVSGKVSEEVDKRSEKKKNTEDKRRKNFLILEAIDPTLLQGSEGEGPYFFQQRYNYKSVMNNGCLVVQPQFDDTELQEYLTELVSTGPEDENIAAGKSAAEQMSLIQTELTDKILFESKKILELRNQIGLPADNINIRLDDSNDKHVYETRSSSSSGDDLMFTGALIVNDRLINGLLNFIFLPSVYNNKYNNEFRQALRYIYAGIGGIYQSHKIAEKYSHITRYLELYMDKIIGLYSSHYKNRQIEFSQGNLFGPCWLGYLPIINNNVLTSCMFICHIFNKVISNYDESLLKTMDGTFEIPLQMFNDMKIENPVVDDLIFGTKKTPLKERMKWLCQNFTNKSFLIPEILEIGINLLKDKLSSTSFKNLEYARGLHNNFMDIAEVTNCISSPRKTTSLGEVTKAIINQKFNKVIKFASNRRTKLQDKSFVDTVLALAEEQFQLVPRKLDLFKKYINSRTKFTRQYIINFENWTTDVENETIINSMKILLKSVNSSIKEADPMFFKKIKLAEWPDHLSVLKNFYFGVNPDFSKNVKLSLQRLDLAESELKVLYIHFNDVKDKLIRNDKYLSHVGVRSTLVELESVFRLTYKRELNEWLQFLMNCASLSPVALLSIVKDPVMIHKLLHDEHLKTFNFYCYQFGPDKYPNLTRYICGCVISKTKLSETNFVAVQASIDEIGSVMRTFFHNSDSTLLYSEFCKLYIMIAQGNWKTGQRLLQGWRERGLPRSVRNKVIFEALRTSNLYNSHNVAAVAFNIIKRHDWSYFAGLAPKAQLGGLRDLLVQDFESKIVLHISEQMALYCLENLPNDILGHPDAKDFALKRMNELLTNPETKEACVFICGDKKKWAQKHSTLFFHKLVDQLFEDSGCKIFLKMVMLEGLKKEIEIPSAFVEYYTKRLIKDNDFNGEEKQSKLIILKFINDPETKQYHKYLLNCLLNNKNYIELFSHMGQGIHHKFSSLYGHAAELASIEIAKYALRRMKFVDAEVEYYRSSDDYTQLLLFKKNNSYVKNKDSLTELSKLYFRYYTNAMMMCNIRESEKTVITSKFGEIYSTYASTEVIPAPFKFYIPNMMLSSAFTPLEVWRVKFAKMQQLFDNGMSLVGCFNFALLENVQYQRFLKPNIFEMNDVCVLPNSSITFVPYMSDVVFGTLSNSEIKILRSQLFQRNITPSHLNLFTEFFQEIETKKSKAFFDLSSPQESILKEIYNLPFSKKYDKMKKIVKDNKQEYNLVSSDKNYNLNEEIVSSENKRMIVLNLLTRSSKTDSVVGEEIRFKLALNSKGIIWGLSGGTREEAINMLRQVTSKNAFYNKSFSKLWEAVVLINAQLKTKINKTESVKFLSELGSKIISETVDFDVGFSNFQTRYFEVNSIITPMKKITHWNSTSKFKLTNQLEQVLSYMIDSKTFLELKPRVQSAELLETDAQKLEAFIGMNRSDILSANLKLNELMLKCIQLKTFSKGVRSSIVITHYDDEWKNIPKAALMYNTVHHWVVDTVEELKYPYSSVEQLLDFCIEVMSCISYLAGTEYCKRFIVTKLFSLPSERYPQELELKESLMTSLLKQIKHLDSTSKLNHDYQVLISLLFDNLTDPSIEVHQEYQEKHTYTELHTDTSGTFQIYTYLKEDGYCSIFMRNSLCIVKTDVTDSNILQYLLELIRKIKNNHKLTIVECLKYLHSNYNYDLLNDVFNLYRHSKFTNRVSFAQGYITTSTFVLNAKTTNFNFLFSNRPILRSFSVKSKKFATQYLHIDALSWKKLQLTVKSSHIGEQAAFIEDILSGRKVGKFEDLRIITKQQNKQWISKNVVDFLLQNLLEVNYESQERLEQKLLPKIRSGQVLKVSGSVVALPEKKWTMEEEEYLNQGGNYYFDSSDNTLVQIEQSTTLKNIISDPFSTLHRLERDKKIPAFLSPYLFISDNFNVIQNYSKKFFENLESDTYLTVSLLIRILKQIPKHMYPLELEDLHPLLLERYNTFLFDLPILDKYFKIEQLYSMITATFSGNVKTFYRIVKPILIRSSMRINLHFEEDEYVLKTNMGLNNTILLTSLSRDLNYNFMFKPVGFSDFIKNLLTYSRNLLNPTKLGVYGTQQEPPLYSDLKDIFEIKSSATVNEIIGGEVTEFMSKSFFEQLLGDELSGETWDQDSARGAINFADLPEDEDFYGGY